MKKYISQIGGVVVSGCFYAILCIFAYIYYGGYVTISASATLLVSLVPAIIEYAFLKSDNLRIFKRKIIRYLVTKIVSFVLMIPIIILYIGTVWNTNAISVILISFTTFIISCLMADVVAGLQSIFNQRN